MRRLLAALLLTATAVLFLVACGDEQEVEPRKTTASAGYVDDVAAEYFAAVASNDPAQVEAAYGTAAPGSPALSYLKLLRDGLDTAGTADRVRADDGRYEVCKTDAPTSCHTFADVALVDGKVDDFTIDGEKVRIR